MNLFLTLKSRRGIEVFGDRDIGEEALCHRALPQLVRKSDSDTHCSVSVIAMKTHQGVVLFRRPWDHSIKVSAWLISISPTVSAI